MTTVLDHEAALPDAPRRSRKKIWLAAVAGLLVVALITAITWFEVYAHTYQPLSNTGGGLFGAVTRPHIEPITDGVSDTYDVLRGPAGTKGVVQYQLGNTRSHAVRIDGLQRTPSTGGDQPLTNLRWASELGPSGQGYESMAAMLNASHPFPMTLRSHSAVLLLVYVTKPNCSSDGTFSYDRYPIQWSAFGIYHVYDFQTTVADDSALPILLCAPASALRHIAQ